LGRVIDLIKKEGIKNPYRRNEILSTNKVIYATQQSFTLKTSCSIASSTLLCPSHMLRK